MDPRNLENPPGFEVTNHERVPGVPKPEEKKLIVTWNNEDQIQVKVERLNSHDLMFISQQIEQIAIKTLQNEVKK